MYRYFRHTVIRNEKKRRKQRVGIEKTVVMVKSCLTTTDDVKNNRNNEKEDFEKKIKLIVNIEINLGALQSIYDELRYTKCSSRGYASLYKINDAMEILNSIIPKDWDIYNKIINSEKENQQRYSFEDIRKILTRNKNMVDSIMTVQKGLKSGWE